MPKRIDVEFGIEFVGTYWTPMYESESYVDSKGNRFRVIHCVCRCGTEKDVLLSNITQGKSVSCGCLRAALQTRHSMCNTRLYRIWENMIQRCSNPHNTAYSNYGGRGITVCNDWKDYVNFHAWAISNGYQDSLSIDRIDVNGNYDPKNCKWATQSEQSNNKRTSRFVEFNGITQTITQWANELKVPAQRIKYRLEHGWSVEDALTIPKQVN